MKQNLYQDFIPDDSSIYLNIFNNNLYGDNKTTQIGVFKDETPVGLFIGIYYPHTLIEYMTKLPVDILGEINLFTKPEFRKQGLAKQAIKTLETMMFTKTDYPPCMIMQEDAYLFKEQFKKIWILPSTKNQGNCEKNCYIIEKKYKEILNNKEKFNDLLKQFPHLNNFN